MAQMGPTEAAAFVPELQHYREQRYNPRHVEEVCAARTGIATRVEGCLGQTTVRARRSRRSDSTINIPALLNASTTWSACC